MKYIATFTATLVTFSCVVSLGQEQPGQADRTQSDYLYGVWSIEGTEGSDAVKGRMTVRPGADGQCRIFNWLIRRSGDRVHGTAVGGFDPMKGQFAEYVFESDGSHFVNRYEVSSVEDVGVIHGERTGIVKGKPYTGKITVDRKGPKHFVYTVSSNNGEDLELVFRKLEDRRAKKKKD